MWPSLSTGFLFQSTALRIWRWGQQVAVVYALYGVDFDVGFFVSGEGDVGKNE